MARFPVPEMILKISELLCCLVAFACIAGFESNGTTIKDFEPYHIPRFNFAIATGVIGFLYALIMGILIIAEVKIPKFVIIDAITCSVLTILFLAAGIVLAVDVRDIANSEFAEVRDLSYLTLEAGIGFTFLSLVLFGCNIALTIKAGEKLEKD
eukprot:m.308523 g.308523  ORF g.308523 m.308523 type:complete len:154 (+) comp44155_c0_seq1:43-504(+)